MRVNSSVLITVRLIIGVISVLVIMGAGPLAQAQAPSPLPGICGFIAGGDNRSPAACVQVWDSYPAGVILGEECIGPDGSFCVEVPEGEYDLRLVAPGYCAVVEYGVASPATLPVMAMQQVPVPKITPYIADYWGTNTTHYGGPVMPGDVIVAYDPDGVACGVAQVKYEGMYVIHVYGDDRGTTPDIDEGAVNRDEITFCLNCNCPLAAENLWYNQAFYEEDLAFDCVVKQPIPLCAPWILMSFNVAVENPARAAVLGSIDGRYRQVISSTCADGAISWDTARPPSLNDLTEMDHAHAYWLYTAAVGDTLWITGLPVPPETPLELCPGWNAISYLPSAPDALQHAWLSIAGMYTFAYGYECDGGARTFDVFRPPDLNDLTCLRPGHGYWVAMSSAAVLTYPYGGYSCAPPPSYTARAVNVAGAVTPTRWVCDFWSPGGPDGPAPGSILTVRDEQDVICGQALVGDDGAFMVHVYGDDATTPADEGAVEGSPLSFEGQEIYYAVSKGPYWMQNNSIEIVLTAGGSSAPLPARHELLQNYPNPFNAQTVIGFTLPVASSWTLSIYDILGRQVDNFAGQAAAGPVAVTWNAEDKASGMYFYRLNAGEFAQVKKMTLMK
jgi:hypothetical protein